MALRGGGLSGLSAALGMTKEATKCRQYELPRVEQTSAMAALLAGINRAMDGANETDDLEWHSARNGDGIGA